MGTKREYIYEIHYIRAIASLMVLLVHVSASYYYQHGQQFNDFTFFINQISRFGTPMFAMISGFLLFYQTRKRGFDLNKFVTSRFTKIGIPFLFWSMFYLSFMYFTEQINPFTAGFDRFLANFISGNSFYHLYFISVVFQFYLIFPLFQMFRAKRYWLFILPAAAIFNIIFIEKIIPDNFDGIIRFFVSQSAFLPKWIYFFAFGGFLAYYWEPIHSFSKKYKIALSLTSIAIVFLAVLEYKSVGWISSNRPTNFINIPILTLFLIGIAKDIEKISWLKLAFKKIGTLSMAIFLVHPFIINIFNKVAPDIFWKTSFFPITFLLILLGTILLIKLIRKLPFSNYILTIPKLKESGVDSANTKGISTLDINNIKNVFKIQENSR